MFKLQGASPLTPFAIMYFQIFVGDPLSGWNVTNVLLWTSKFTRNASASGGKPPDPLCYNIFPDIYWRSPFRVKGCKFPPFNTYGFTQMLQLQGASPLTSFAMIYFQIFDGDPLSMENVTNFLLLTYGFIHMLQLQGASPLAPFNYLLLVGERCS